MKKLIAVATLGLALGFPSLSFADNYVFGVKTPIVASEVKNEVRGGKVEKDFISFYTTPKTANSGSSLRAGQTSDDDEDHIVVFGVRIPVSPRT